MHTNRLAQESSPYLLQHAHNPVDWHPWGPEAFAAAKQRDKPIFLSVGYSTCYWCHVMERQSFENEAIAAEMNSRFLNVKVDREERPDVDQLYMNAVQAMTGQGGWPMSVFLTPDLMPFYGGTYFPPSDGHGRVGFPRLLAAIDDAWKNRRAQVLQSAEQLVAAVRKMGEPAAPRAAVRIDRAFIEEMLDRSTADYDPVAGGFGSAPKFPRETLLELILSSQRHFPNATRLRQVLHTLDAMAAGGIHDHLGGAFHRYSTDNQWLLPHFEIMLYDNAMLTWIYAEAFAQTRERKYATVARGIADFILREMTSPEGAFYTALDAEVDAREGEPYLWTADEIAEILGSDAELFNRTYGVADGPNFVDPHQSGAAPEKNILYLPRPIDEATDQKLAPMRAALYARRRQRKQPLLDTKILTSWNALMIRGLAHAGEVLEEPRYLAAATKAADFLLAAHRTGDELHRVSREGKVKGIAFLDDYAFLARALLDLGRRYQAEQVAKLMCDKFLDTGGGFFFTAANAPDMIVRQKTGSDSPLPSGNAVAAELMLQLNQPNIARQTLVAFAGQLERFGEGMSAMVQSAAHYVLVAGDLSVAGEQGEDEEIITVQADWSAPDRLAITLNITPGFHLNANPAADGLIATHLALTGKFAQSVAGIDYPPGKMQKFEFADGAIPIYDGAVTVTVRFNRPVAEAAGEQMMFSLQYQACDENSCRAPARKAFSMTIE